MQFSHVSHSTTVERKPKDVVYGLLASTAARLQAATKEKRPCEICGCPTNETTNWFALSLVLSPPYKYWLLAHFMVHTNISFLRAEGIQVKHDTNALHIALRTYICVMADVNKLARTMG